VSRSDLAALLRCPECRSPLRLLESSAACANHSFPVVEGVPRLLPADLMALFKGENGTGLRARTYRSFGFEWTSFSQQLEAYGENFRWYLEPLGGVSLEGRRVLDAGCGMGRHTHHFLRAGAEVVAVDASRAIDRAASNCATDGAAARALFVQADLLRLPVAPDSFDLVSCLGVLHHVEDTLGGLRALTAAVHPGGHVLVFLYHDGGTSPIRRGLLRAVRGLRALTTRLPFPLLRALTLLLAVGLWAVWVVPLRLLRRHPRWRAPLASLPLGQYADYPFRVLWNDQFDRFSAPLEKRYRREEVQELMTAAGLEDVVILPGYGWRAVGRRPCA
jgi:SAM-dependent methyltransferase